MVNCEIHPEECLDFIEPNNPICRWCEDIKRLENRITTLRNQLRDQAVVIESGEVTLRCAEIGLLEITGGIVNFSELNSHTLGPLKT